MKSILVPIDFSACSENALVFAIRLAAKIKSTIQVLNVSSFNSDGIENPTMVSLAIEEQMERSKKLMKRSIQKTLDSVRASIDRIPTIQANAEMGVVGTKIYDIASNNQSNFIVMGTQGENSILDKYLGSIAANILENAPCPVIVIPESAKFKEKMVLGYATDLQDADPFEIWKSSKLLKSFQPEIRCVHFTEKQVVNKDKMEKLNAYFSEVVPDLKIAFYNLPVKDKVKGMNDFIENQNINMLVMYKPQRNFFDALFHRSFTKKMAMHINIPLLVIKEKR